MKKATSILVAAVAALTLSGGAYAQNNTLATPSVVSPAANTTGAPSAPSTTSGYGTPGAANSDSGMGAGSPNSGLPNGTTAGTPAYGSNNTLAKPTTASPAGK